MLSQYLHMPPCNCIAHLFVVVACMVLFVSQVQQVATLAELETILEISGDAIVCVEFTAAWCAPCQQIAPAFEALSLELENVAFLKVDVDDNEVGLEADHSPTSFEVIY